MFACGAIIGPETYLTFNAQGKTNTMWMIRHIKTNQWLRSKTDSSEL